MSNSNITAAMLVIGDEILSGRTKDRNIGHLADVMTTIGVDLREVRIVCDEESEIVEAVNTLRGRYNYVFTSGGIGPTHDDITAESVSAAFGVACTYHPEAYALLEDQYAKMDLEFTTARKRMARTPEGASLIANPVSKAPGFRMGNVFVMAGVPKIMQAMLDNVVPTLDTGKKLISMTIPCSHGEGTIGEALGEIQLQNPQTMIGSYPRFENGNMSTDIVVRSREQSAIDTAADAINNLLAQLDQKRQSGIQR